MRIMLTNGMGTADLNARAYLDKGKKELPFQSWHGIIGARKFIAEMAREDADLADEGRDAIFQATMFAYKAELPYLWGFTDRDVEMLDELARRDDIDHPRYESMTGRGTLGAFYEHMLARFYLDI
jgi:hypothetical protein